MEEAINIIAALLRRVDQLNQQNGELNRQVSELTRQANKVKPKEKPAE